jgi:hypothetical protein
LPKRSLFRRYLKKIGQNNKKTCFYDWNLALYDWNFVL